MNSLTPFSYRFEYSLTEKDAESFLIFNAKSPYYRPWRILMWLAPLFVASFAYLFSGNAVYFWAAIFIYILMVATSPFDVKIEKLVIKNRIKKHPSQYLLGENQILILNNNEIKNQSKYKKGKFSWNEIKHVLSDANNIYLYLSFRSTIMIPRRLFNSNEEYEKFICKVKEAHTAARKNPGGVA